MKKDDAAREPNKSKRFLHEVFDDPEAFKTNNKVPIPEHRGTRTLFARPTTFDKCDVSIKRNPR